MTVYDYDGTSYERDQELAAALFVGGKGTLAATFPAIFGGAPLWVSYDGYANERRCSTCRVWKPATEFAPHTGHPLGVEYRCMDCDALLNPPLPPNVVIWKRPA